MDNSTVHTFGYIQVSYLELDRIDRKEFKEGLFVWYDELVCEGPGGRT
jgi:hypothetical protein